MRAMKLKGSLWRTGWLGGLLLIMALQGIGCGSDDNPQNNPTTGETTDDETLPTTLEVAVNFSEPDVKLEGADLWLKVTLFEYRPGQSTDDLTGDSSDPLVPAFSTPFDPTQIYRIEEAPVGIRMVVVAEISVLSGDSGENRVIFARGNTIVDALREGETYRIPDPVSAKLLPLVVKDQYLAVIYLLPELNFQKFLDAILQLFGGGGDVPNPPQGGGLEEIYAAVQVLVEFLESLRMNTVFTFYELESSPTLVRGELCVDSFLVTDPNTGDTVPVEAPITITGDIEGQLEDLVSFASGHFQQPLTFSNVLFNINTSEIIDLFFDLLIDTLESQEGANEQLIAVLKQLQSILTSVVPDIPLPPLEGGATAETKDSADFQADKFIEGELWTTISYSQISEPIEIRLTFEADNKFSLKPTSPCK